MRELLQWASACEQERLLQARSHAQPALYDSRRRSQPSAWQDRARRSRLLRLPDLARGYSTTLKARRRDRTEPTSRARHRRASAARALRLGVSSSCDCAPTARLERLFACERQRGRPTPTSFRNAAAGAGGAGRAVCDGDPRVARGLVRAAIGLSRDRIAVRELPQRLESHQARLGDPCRRSAACAVRERPV